ncbi:MAG: exodeoxyribonuclease VII large subunit [Planctomycetes bacterium]|nr:exodeoxyribonuclease VII large subunit [Planctomycetota bacterium]
MAFGCYNAPMVRKASKIYSVNQVNTLVKVALEDGLPSRMIVRGEVSGWRPHSTGHCYFSLKDKGGILPCVMWKSKVKGVKFAVEDGQSVLATGYVDVYTPGGKYQFYADKLEVAGVGELQLRFEEMVKRLKGEGLFADEHKQSLPPYPMRIGIVTSGSGAAVRDIADSVYSRWPCAKLYLYPVAVQGKGAGKEIANAVNAINRRNAKLKLDVMIVGRGGGSMEDLWAFNEEVVARAIFASAVPVISAVGHEIDFTIADFVADARASTPTKAGVIAVPDADEVLERLHGAQKRLEGNAENKVAICGHELRAICGHIAFSRPGMVVVNAVQRVDEAAGRLKNCKKELISGYWGHLRGAYEQVRRIEPHRLLGVKKVEMGKAESDMRKAIGEVLGKNMLQITAVENRLAGLDPRGVLNRGYSITMNEKTGKAIRAASEVAAGDVVVTELASREKLRSKIV